LLVAVAARGVIFRPRLRQLLDSAGEVVEPLIHRGEIVAVGFIGIGARLHVHGFLLGLLDVLGIEPFARGVFRRFAFRPFQSPPQNHIRTTFEMEALGASRTLRGTGTH